MVMKTKTGTFYEAVEAVSAGAGKVWAERSSGYEMHWAGIGPHGVLVDACDDGDSTDFVTASADIRATWTIHETETSTCPGCGGPGDRDPVTCDGCLLDEPDVNSLPWAFAMALAGYEVRHESWSHGKRVGFMALCRYFDAAVMRWAIDGEAAKHATGWTVRRKA